jgi:hypothetical protein
MLRRRNFLVGGMLGCAASAFAGDSPFAASGDGALRIGLVADLHYAEKPAAATRYYRDTPAKLADAARQFANSGVELVVVLGDAIDTGKTQEDEMKALVRVAELLRSAPGRLRFVLGNHCVERLTKEQFLKTISQEKSFFSFDVKARHFIVLDACFRRDDKPYGGAPNDWTDSNIPADQVKWLRNDLAGSPGKAFVFVHQRLDAPPPYGVGNAAEVRRVLEASGKVVAVFQGHQHAGDRRTINGIDYVTLRALIEGKHLGNNAFAALEIPRQGAWALQGYGNQPSVRPK